MLNKQIEVLLTEKLGQPKRVTKKVHAWSLNSNADIVLETNYELATKSAVANVWLPIAYKDKVDPTIATTYPVDKGRHSNTYVSNGMERGKAALKLKLNSVSQATTLLAAVA